MLEDATAMAVIPVHDLGKARTFYEKMLGLKPASVAHHDGEAIYALGATKLMVYETRADLGGATKVTIEVKDLEMEMGNLRNHGVVFEELDMPNIKTTNGVVEDEVGKAAWFKDFDGNWIAFTQLKG